MPARRLLPLQGQEPTPHWPWRVHGFLGSSFRLWTDWSSLCRSANGSFSRLLQSGTYLAQLVASLLGDLPFI